MRKSVVASSSERASRADALAASDARWLDLEELAQIEVTSEDPNHPVEGALVVFGNNSDCVTPPTQTCPALSTAMERPCVSRMLKSNPYDPPPR